MPLKLSLAKGEKLVINGAVVKNDGPDVNLVFENQAHILRQKDILAVEDAQSPAKRVYLSLQCAYMFDDRRDSHLDDFKNLLGELIEAAPSLSETADEITKLVSDDNIYGALKQCRSLIDREAEILSHVQ